ncbi:uncharacterized protein BT62DRAFT_943270 [Guyanagaster necrorhizus]|uniref:ARID domain-containing protein n=1 Tax=Guyanagaster necrorhizus TaxID=856835 RepID=A0A9P7VZA3_9AGAR|nr:uncharacterized protein BT62DRAFT_943270 [Guyanagaster necrorhizus MCA 3950]KAG7450361.1 hypothetical protein BT62DRAFT_943270 [Guyanagaster necrorhizus MCA 3950]
MLPQNGLPLRSQQAQQPLMSSNPAGFDASFFNLDASQAAKQMAALSAASNARMANSRSASVGGTSSGSYLGGITSGMHSNVSHDQSISAGGHPNLNAHSLPQPANTSFLDPSMSNPAAPRPGPSSAQYRQRHQGFLAGLANIMAKRNTPLPPALIGISTPNYDPNTSQFKMIEPSQTEIGCFRLAGRDIDLFKLWGLTIQQGGGSVIGNPGTWAAIASQFDLPEELPQPHASGTTSSAHALQACYMLILAPFEDLYKKNVQDQQRKAQLSSRQGNVMNQRPGTPTRPGQTVANGMQSGFPNQTPRGLSGFSSANALAPQTTHQGSTVSSVPQPGPSVTQISVPQSVDASHVGEGQSSDTNVLEDIQGGIKRKLDTDDGEGKRARQKTGSELADANTSVAAASNSDPSQSVSTMAGPTRTRTQPLRRKIEYVPYAREVETYGGRDLKGIEAELAPHRERPLRDINDWGTVDIEAITLSLSSRISTELSYALTTLTILSTMKGQSPGSGFPLHQCGDLFDELLDFMEELALEGVQVQDTFELSTTGIDIPTHRQLVNAVYEAEAMPFAGLERRQGSADLHWGLRPRPGDTILMVLTIIRNLTMVGENIGFISQQHRLVDLLLRLCVVVREGVSLRAFAPALSLSDLIAVRKDTMVILSCIAGHILFSHPSSPSKGTLKTATRLFQLCSSYIIDPVEAVSPMAYVQLKGTPNHAPPSLADLSLEVFTRLSQLDSNRQVFAKAIPSASIFLLFSSLVHRLPISDVDFQVITRESWLSYLERVVMGIYSLAFLASPSLKNKVKTDRAMGFKGVMLRMIQKFLMHSNPDARAHYMVCARRAIEAMKVLDDGEDSFDTSKSVAPTMSFGMGWGEVGDASSEQGTGLLGGHRTLAWDLLMQREVSADEVMFGELESLARVEC